MNKTLYEKIFDNHIIEKYDDIYLLYLDAILLHEVTSPQAFFAIKKKNLWDKKKIFSTSDHNISTEIKKRFFFDKNFSQLIFLKKNFEKYFFKYYDVNNPNQGIIHINSCENFFLFPGMIAICGDSHTTTNGALSLIANGIGTTDLEIGISTNCILQKKLKTMNIILNNNLKNNITSKDLILHIIKKISSKGGVGYCIEFSGNCIKNFSISERMTLCNMSIEAGSKISLISPDYNLIKFYEKKIKNFYLFENYLKKLKTKNAKFDKVFSFDSDNINPKITWGTNLDTIIDLNEKINSNDENMLNYMGLKNNSFLHGIKVDKVFIGSCTNSRFEDLLLCSQILLKLNKKINKFIDCIIVPGSEKIKKKSEFFGIDKIFLKYGFKWKNSGCSMCLAMNSDKLLPYERCVSTSNRNFIGRQGYKGRTHLSSPILAIIISIYGEFIDLNTYNKITNEINFKNYFI
ncbi:3-isopropylmalate dehydratase large subunit [Candidatus Carsonella ruddii CS isolate Thao2000]|uniref:3-isopropylmalate dehydratase n=1 Tax=Candidatus Carsonella ruddii CS isolate Thao2000 TaxID=1202537 RepID=J7GTA5_CARRU|nr:aconitase family protein [Candidatus Carsonella ruddii]AFP83754.1 3-isopropylmalate dehydratase large subunit [Candidatus Carsonella ruddii CS isolate Thao2000]